MKQGGIQKDSVKLSKACTGKHSCLMLFVILHSDHAAAADMNVLPVHIYFRFNTFCSDACTVPLQLRVESRTARWLVQWALDIRFRVCWKGLRQAPAVLLENAETRRLMSLH